jgi:hypothetical protein
VVPLHPDATEDTLALSDGAVARIADDALELRDRAGRLLIRYADGSAEVFAPERDLTLSAPKGRVVVEAGTDLDLRAARDLHHGAGRTLRLDAVGGRQQLELSPGRTHLTTPRLDVEAKQSRLATREATLVARTIATTAERLAHRVERYELTAESLIEKTRDAFREATGLCESRVGRAKTWVRDRFSLESRTTCLRSRESTSIDGERILLG